MAFTFTATTDGSAQARDYVRAGWYEATVYSATEKTSKSGNPMIELELDVEVGRPRPMHLKSWLVLTQSCAWKIEQFMAATGDKITKGMQFSVDARNFEGRRLCVVLCNRLLDGGGLWPEVFEFRRREDCPHMGAMTPEELEQWGLRANGTRKGVREYLLDDDPTGTDSAVNYGDQVPAPSAHARAKANGFAPAPMPLEDDDDIPF